MSSNVIQFPRALNIVNSEATARALPPLAGEMPETLPPQTVTSEVSLVSYAIAAFSFRCLISKSTGDSMPLFVYLRFGL